MTTDVASLSEVQRKFEAVPWVADQTNYNTPEYWERCALAIEDGPPTGDCEDTALGRLFEAMKAGWAIERLRIGICYVEPFQLHDDDGQWRWATQDERCHCVLVVTTEHDGELILDNRYPRDIMTLQALRINGYSPLMIQEAGGSKVFREWIWS